MRVSVTLKWIGKPFKMAYIKYTYYFFSAFFFTILIHWHDFFLQQMLTVYTATLYFSWKEQFFRFSTNKNSKQKYNENMLEKINIKPHGNWINQSIYSVSPLNSQIHFSLVFFKILKLYCRDFLNEGETSSGNTQRPNIFRNFAHQIK